MAEDGLAGPDVAPLVFDAAGENPARGRLVDRVGALEVPHVDGEQVRLEHAIDAGQAEGGLALAAEVIQPGQSLAFEAVVGDMPLAASRFLLEPLAPPRNVPLATAGDLSPGP